MYRILIIVLLICIPLNVWAATYTSCGSGNWSNAATWDDGVLGCGLTVTVPAAGDKAIISTGHTVVVDSNTTVGSNAGAVGHAITINATNSTTYGKLVVSDGISLTLRGFDLTSNTMMLINQYGVFEPAPGATVIGDVAGDYTSFILNKGIINAVGTSPKHIAFTSPSGAYSWNNSGSEAFSGSSWKFDPSLNIAAVPFTHKSLSDAAGTRLGTMADQNAGSGGGAGSAVTITGTDAAIFSNPVATRSLIVSSGDYFIDFNVGVLYFYRTSGAGNPSFTKNYKYFTLSKGWGISSIQNTTYNEAKFDYCDFSYMGANTNADSRAIDVKFKQSASVAANRLFYLKNSRMDYTGHTVGLKNCDGTLADPLLITGNTVTNVIGDSTIGGWLTFYRLPSTYITIDNNDLRSFAQLIGFYTFGSVLDFTGINITNNQVTAADNFVGGVDAGTRFPASSFSYNTIDGVGNGDVTGGARQFMGVGGTSASHLTISNNTITRGSRAIHQASYLDILNNTFIKNLHHGIPSATLEDLQITGINIKNNIFVGELGSGIAGYDQSPSIETGYNHKLWLDNYVIENNTFVGNPSGWLGFGDMTDANTYTLGTRLTIRNNLSRMITSGTSKSMQRRANASDALVRLHVSQWDYNLDYNYATRYTNLTRQGTFTGITNVAGVSLFDPNFSSKSGGSLVLTHTSTTSRTLTWGGGTPVQIVLDNGTATAGANTSASGVVGLYNGTLTDSGKTFNTTKNNASCPAQHWIVITGGTGSGQIRAITNNTATVLTVVPGWITVPDATSTYAIIKAEVTLQNSGATETVQAGVYLPDLPTSSQTDSSVGFADHSITASDPLLSNPAGLTFADMTPASNSPAADSGYGAAGTDIGAVPISSGPVSGVCGSNSGSSFDTLASGTANNCTSGTVSSFTGTGPWSWTCAGSGGGTDSGTCSASINQYTVTPSIGANGSMAPSVATLVNYGATTAFTVSPSTCYAINTVSGCSGSLVGSTYTKGAITGNCTVTSSFSASGTTYTITPSNGAHGTVSPSSPVSGITCGGTSVFTITPAAKYRAFNSGTCPGSISVNTYTAGPITGNCTVVGDGRKAVTGGKFKLRFGF